MKPTLSTIGVLSTALIVGSTLMPAQVAVAQDADDLVEEVVVTGSRIRRNPLNESAAIMDLSMGELDKAGLTNFADALQQLPISGSAINSGFNVPGNSGFPQDGSGIGAGAVQLSLRNIGAKRTLVLVDGRRWIAGASASGVPNAVDLNTVPANVIDRIELLQDGASAIYGSDAIGGVVNIITKQSFQGFQIDASAGSFLSEGDGEAYNIAGIWGGGNDTTNLVLSMSYAEEGGVETADRARSAFPSPDATSCLAGGCSSGTPQARIFLGPALNNLDITLNDGVLNDGMGNIPQFDVNDPTGGADFHNFTAADRFNFNGPGFNFLQTPNERVNIYANVTHEFTDRLSMFARGSYTNRSSETKGAPEPLFMGDGAGSRITDNFVVAANNPFNPFGVDLSVADQTLLFMGRRPLESGGRLFFQDVNTYFVSAGLLGDFDVGDNTWYWDLTGSYGDNRGFQQKFNSHNAAKLQVAMGDVNVCNATPNCVPFNYFGGQGPDGTGSITEEMLDFVRFTQRDFSEQTLKDYSANLTGDIFEMPGGPMGFAVGIEFRDHQGSFQPDPIAASGETAGIPSGATAGGFDVFEYYAEVNLPLLSDAPLVEYLEVNLAARNSDYSTSGSEATYKISGLWRPIESLSVRASFGTGIRAPGIGELFGGAAREDFNFLDPCADVFGVIPSGNGGRLDVVNGPNPNPQPQNIIDNCAVLGVPTDLAQANPQLSAVSTGNTALVPETSENWTAGFVYSPAFAESANWTTGLTMSLDYYNLVIDDAIQGRSPGEVITACVDTLDPFFCDNVPRGVAGGVGLVSNQLGNIGGIDANGLDLMLTYASPEWGFGQIIATINATYLSEYTERTLNPDGSESSKSLEGTHPDETFFRAFPEWRAVTSFDWFLNSWNGNLRFRYIDEMTGGDDAKIDSVTYTDISVGYTPQFMDDSFTVTLGANNVFDEDPPVGAFGIINMSPVAHDLPGTFGYLRVTWRN